MATVEVTFTPLPVHVRTARLVATAVARRSGVDESLLDEVRLAVGEACWARARPTRRTCPPGLGRPRGGGGKRVERTAAGWGPPRGGRSVLRAVEAHRRHCPAEPVRIEM